MIIHSPIRHIPSINFHVWEPCNMRCDFCFATFQDVKRDILPKGHLPKSDAITLVRLIALHGFSKITFAGGEPTLCPWLSELIQEAKNHGMTTMIITNGTSINDKFLSENKATLDWIGVSIDSLNYHTNVDIGRAVTGKTPLSREDYYTLIDKIKEMGFGLKINTVVNAINHKEDLSQFINFARPKRWKVMQVLPVTGQNDGKVERLKVTESEFVNFVNRHQDLIDDVEIIPESNNDLKSSYVMVDPAGRFFTNTSDKYSYSSSILKAGVDQALRTMDYDYNKFERRGGLYDWNRVDQASSNS